MPVLAGQPALLFAVGQYLHCQEVRHQSWPGREPAAVNLPGLGDWHYESGQISEAESSQWRYVLTAMQLIRRLT